jgi:hypothetical protein
MSPAPPPAKGGDTARTQAATANDSTRVFGICAAAWLVPGAGHFLVGQTQKAVVFFVVLITMVAVGLTCGGRLFPFQLAEPLVFLAAIAQWLVLLPRVLASMAGLGQGDIVAAAYEYGNTFLIVAGLLNALVILDVFDRATGRKRA